MRKIAQLLLLALPIVCVSCGPKAKFLAPDYSKPDNIAILPTVNQTIDVKGGIVFRNLFYLELQKKKTYTIVNNEMVDSLLNENGITDGGQLKTTTNEELCNILKTDGLIYVDLIECKYQSIGISETRKIKVNLKLYTRTNRLLWEDERKVDHGKSAASSIFGAVLNPTGALKKAGSDLVEQNVVKGLKGWLLDHELKPEMDEVVQITVKTLPK